MLKRKIIFLGVILLMFNFIGCDEKQIKEPLNDSKADSILTINANQTDHAISSDLYGIFFEDINHAADGGLYAELIQNRSFEYDKIDNPAYSHLTAWSIVERGVGKVEARIDDTMPLNDKNANYLVLSIIDSGEGVGIMNNGYNTGINIKKDEKYNFSFYARRNKSFDQPVKIKLESPNGILYGEAQVIVNSNEWKKYTATIKANADDVNGRLVILTEGTGEVYVDMVSLFPEHTFKNRPNGLRADIAQMIADLKPAFVRFPGGCIVHNGSTDRDARDSMYVWKDTIGDIAERPARKNSWGYNQSFGLGYYEYFLFCEDIGAKPIPVLPVGINPHDNSVVPISQMGPWIQDALDLIEFANGDITTEWGSKRAELGHPEPFKLEYIAIGNEEVGLAYFERFKLFQEAIKEKYPSIKVISSSGPWSQGVEYDQGWQFSKIVKADLVDEHYYNQPEWFLSNWHRYDAFDRNGPKVFVGEYASWGNTFYNALAEAAYMTGLERNADIVELASYAPLLANADYVNWQPNLIWFNNNQVYGTVNYYVQKMFSNNKGDVLLPATLTGTMKEGKEPEPIQGKIGIGTWLTQAQYDDVVVKDNNGKILFSDDFSADASKWTKNRGNWAIQNGAYIQSSNLEDCRSIAGDSNWANYTITMKAKKNSGSEGFLIMFGVKDSDNYYWWNIGGWGNTKTAIEKSVNGIKSSIVEAPVTIQTGREYEIKIEVSGRRIRCYLDNELIHDIEDKPSDVEPLYYSVSKEYSTGDIIIKAVNARDSAIHVEVLLNGTDLVLPDGAAIELTAENLTDTNSFAKPTNVVPLTKQITGLGKRFIYDFPQYSITILRLKTDETK